jgi:hypothetical protein
MGRAMSLFSVVLALEDDPLRVRMGRFSEADEQLMKRLLSGRPALAASFGRGPGRQDMARPAAFSTRPTLPGGGECFTFSHRTVAKRTLRDPAPGREYVEVPRGLGAEALYSAGLRRDPGVRVGGRSGGWYAPAGGVPTGFARAMGGVAARPRGQRPGTAAAAQRYVERDGAVEADREGPVEAGNLPGDAAARRAFWRAVEEEERAGGRVQGRIVAELPWEEAVGAAGRRRILEGLVAEFERLGLRCHAVAHAPEPGTDRRNHHLHLLYHDRPAEPVDGGWRFARGKVREVTARGWLKALREHYAALANREFEAAGLARRFDARSYREAGLAKAPGRHLGSAASALERRGVATAPGTRNWAGEAAWRLAKAAAARRAEGEEATARGHRAASLAAALAESSGDVRLEGLAADLLDGTARWLEAARAMGEARGVAERLGWRRADLLRRPARAAAAGGPAGEEAAEVARDLAAAFAEPRREAALRLVEARRGLAAAARNLARLETEAGVAMLLRERARLAARLGAVEREARTFGEGARAEAGAREGLAAALRAESAARAALTDALRNRYGDAVWLAEATETRSGRKRLAETILAGGGVEGGDDAAAAAGILALARRLDEAEERRLAAAGSLERTRRAGLAAGPGRDPRVAAAELRGRLEEIDARIAAWPSALAAAERAGLRLSGARKREHGRER